MCLPGQGPPFPRASPLAGVACSQADCPGTNVAPTSLCTSAPPQHAGGPQQPPRRPGSAQPDPQDWTQLQNGASGCRQSAQVNAGHRVLVRRPLVPALGQAAVVCCPRDVVRGVVCSGFP